MKESKIFVKNSEVVEEVDYKLYQEVFMDRACIPDITVSETSENFVITNAKGLKCYVWSNYNKNQELFWLFNNCDPKTEYLVYLGSINMNAVRMIRKIFKKLVAVFFIEPTNQIFQAVLHKENVIDIAKAGSSLAVHFICNRPIVSFVKDISKICGYGSKLTIVASLPYQIIFADYYQQLKSKLLEELRLKTTQVITGILNRKNFVYNTLQNYRKTAVNGMNLKTILRDKPAIIVGAGPSLKKNINLLQSAADKAFIFACGSSLPILLQYGIKPHFNVIYEAGDNSLFTASDSYRDIPLIYAHQVNPASLAAYQGKKISIITNTDDLTVHYLMPSDQPTIQSGPSVVNITQDFICKMGASMVIFMGQDMCMYNGKIHAIDDKFISGEDYEYKSDFLTEDIYGNQVEVLLNYWVIKEYLEKVIREYPDIAFINATEGGVGIKGAVNECLADVLAMLPNSKVSLAEQIDAFLTENDCDNQLSNFVRLQKSSFASDVDKCIMDAKRILGHIHELEACQSRSKQKQLITRIVYQYSKLEQQSFYQGVLAPNFADLIQTTKARYQANLVSHNQSDKIAGVIGQYENVLQDILKFCIEIKKMTKRT